MSLTNYIFPYVDEGDVQILCDAARDFLGKPKRNVGWSPSLNWDYLRFEVGPGHAVGFALMEYQLQDQPYIMCKDVHDAIAKAIAPSPIAR